MKDKKISSTYELNCEKADIIWEKLDNFDKIKFLEEADISFHSLGTINSEMKYLALRKAGFIK